MSNKNIKSLAVLTSGGDSPGMNCAIRSVVRTAIHQGIKPVGVMRGYQGILDKDFKEMNESSVGNILQRGGTILKTSRCLEFHQAQTRKQAADNLKQAGIDGLVVIGGDGSFNGAHLLSSENDIPVIGIPGTIDNDISGTNYTIGFDTAVQTALEAVDKIRDTASSHNRIFVVEVMGRNSGAIALHVGVGCGAENILFPDQEIQYDEVIKDMERGRSRGKDSSILIVAEGHVSGRSYEIQKTLKEKYQIRSRVCILGHTQRGGSPTALDRYLASRMGHEAVLGFKNYQSPLASVFVEGEICLAPLSECLGKRNTVETKLSEMARILAI